jgi:hypothetical protein
VCPIKVDEVAVLRGDALTRLRNGWQLTKQRGVDRLPVAAVHAEWWLVTGCVDEGHAMISTYSLRILIILPRFPLNL